MALTICCLPPEILVFTFKFLGKEVRQAAGVCRRWYELADEEGLWRIVCANVCQAFPDDIPKLLAPPVVRRYLHLPETGDLSWKQIGEAIRGRPLASILASISNPVGNDPARGCIDVRVTGNGQEVSFPIAGLKATITGSKEANNLSITFRATSVPKEDGSFPWPPSFRGPPSCLDPECCLTGKQVVPLGVAPSRLAYRIFHIKGALPPFEAPKGTVICAAARISTHVIWLFSLTPTQVGSQKLKNPRITILSAIDGSFKEIPLPEAAFPFFPYAKHSQNHAEAGLSLAIRIPDDLVVFPTDQSQFPVWNSTAKGYADPLRTQYRSTTDATLLYGNDLVAATYDAKNQFYLEIWSDIKRPTQAIKVLGPYGPGRVYSLKIMKKLLVGSSITGDDGPNPILVWNRAYSLVRSIDRSRVNISAEWVVGEYLTNDQYRWILYSPAEGNRGRRIWNSAEADLIIRVFPWNNSFILVRKVFRPHGTFDIHLTCLTPQLSADHPPA